MRVVRQVVSLAHPQPRSLESNHLASPSGQLCCASPAVEFLLRGLSSSEFRAFVGVVDAGVVEWGKVHLPVTERIGGVCAAGADEWLSFQRLAVGAA